MLSLKASVAKFVKDLLSNVYKVILNTKFVIKDWQTQPANMPNTHHDIDP